tara:strand:+ start:805 stop:1167 length:363 start_codon:yes stop_codon:yes gene_type:complete
MSKVNRISPRSLKQLVEGKVTEKVKCVVKFYSNECHLCHNLKEYYDEISTEYDDVHFFAFNVGDDHSFEDRLKFNGVPSIFMFDIDPPAMKIARLADPETPHEHTWYTVNAIKSFIEGGK